jgi:outer membrane protein TolC
MRRWNALLALSVVFPGGALAQDTLAIPERPVVLATLTLQEALDQARASSPAYRQVLNDAAPARWAVRNAWGSFLPSASVSSGFGYTGTGESRFGGNLTNATPSILSSSYNVGLQWQLDGQVLSGPGLQKANQRAVEADINNAGVLLGNDITDQYLAALQASAQVDVSRQQVERNNVFLQLAQARFSVGQATLLDVRQAEVIQAQSVVALLQNIQNTNAAKIELFRRMGISPPVAVQQVALPDSFPVVAPDHELDQLLEMAGEEARERAAAWSVRSAKSAFLPSLFAQAGWSGFSQELTDRDALIQSTLLGARAGAADCQFQNDVLVRLTSPHPAGTVPNCNAAAGLDATGTALDPTVQQLVVDNNNVFPFDFTTQPFQASISISLPIFTGFGRSLQLSQAKAIQQDADENLRAGALQVRAQVNTRFLALQTAYRAIFVQEKSREAAREQLRLAQDRYRLGSGTSLELSDAQNAVQQAEGDYVNAVYAYHRALAALEAAVGQPLR